MHSRQLGNKLFIASQWCSIGSVYRSHNYGFVPNTTYFNPGWFNDPSNYFIIQVNFLVVLSLFELSHVIEAPFPTLQSWHKVQFGSLGPDNILAVNCWCSRILFIHFFVSNYMLHIFLSVLIFIEWIIVCFAECWQLCVTWDQTLAWEFCEDCVLWIHTLQLRGENIPAENFLAEWLYVFLPYIIPSFPRSMSC